MRSCSFIFCLLSLLSTPFQAFGQTIPSPVRRDPDAISVLTKSIQALGGLPSTNIVSSCTASGQALIFRGGSQSGPPASFIETDTLNGHIWDLTLHVSQGSHVKDVGKQSGKPFITRDGSPITLPPSSPTSHPPFYLPALLFANAIADSSYSIVDRGTDMRGGVPRRHVQIIPSEKGTPEQHLRQDWIFDNDQFFPVEVGYTLVAGSRIETASPKRIVLSDFKKLSGQLAAGTLLYYSGTVLDEQRTIESVKVGQQSNTSDSAVTGGGL